MSAVLQIYFNSTFTRSTLSKIIYYIMRFILLIKLCLCILWGNIPGIFAPMRKGPYGNFSKTEKLRHNDVTLFMQSDGVLPQRNFFLHGVFIKF